MQTVSQTTIDEIHERLMGTSPEEAQALMQRMAVEQPAILAYLLACDEDILPESDRGTLMLLGILIWESFSAVQSPLHMVTPEELDAAEELNLKVLETLAEDSEAGYLAAVQKLTESYNQMPLLGVVLEELMADDEEEPELVDENSGLAMLNLKTVIDCLDR
jgi:hypothetical protein